MSLRASADLRSSVALSRRWVGCVQAAFTIAATRLESFPLERDTPIGTSLTRCSRTLRVSSSSMASAH
jgi:hypothetical protein